MSETEDQEAFDHGLDTRQPGLSSPKTGQTDLAQRDNTETNQEPGLSRLRSDGTSPSREKAANGKHQVSRPQNRISPIVAGPTLTDDDRATPQTEINETNDHNETISQKKQWRTHIRQALAETRDTSTLASKCRDFHLRLVSILTDIGAALLSNT